MRLLLCFLLLSVPCHSQVETAPTQSFLNLLGSVSAVSSASIFPDRIKIHSPAAPAAFLDDQRFRAFAATDLSQGAIDTTLRHANDAYELWMGPPYSGKNQAKAIYIMITGEDLEAGAIANREYCDHLIDTGFAVADWCDPETRAIETRASRSQILDTDYAVTTSSLAKAKILNQASTAMLAQANSAPDIVMMLLQPE